MDRKAQLQFRFLHPDAQRAAIRRLALHGLEEIEIARETGWTSAQVRRFLEPAGVAEVIPWALSKPRRSEPLR